MDERDRGYREEMKKRKHRSVGKVAISKITL